MLWSRLDLPGHEYAEVRGESLAGVALFTHEGQACRLDYEVLCDASWNTTRATVRGAVGQRRIEVVVRAEGGRWSLNGQPVPAVDGCIDVDLNFSPSTNLLPIRRLGLAIDQEAIGAGLHPGEGLLAGVAALLEEDAQRLIALPPATGTQEPQPRQQGI